MDNQALEGAVSIFGMTVILLIPLNYLEREFVNQNFTYLMLGIIIIVGLINGFIFRDKIIKSILYFVGLGELLLIGLFILFYSSVQQQAGNTTSPTDALGVIIIVIFLFVLLLVGAVGLLIFGVVIYIPAIIGAKLRGKSQSSTREGYYSMKSG